MKRQHILRQFPNNHESLKLDGHLVDKEKPQLGPSQLKSLNQWKKKRIMAKYQCQRWIPYSARWRDQFGGKTLSQEWTRSDIGSDWVHCDPQLDPIKLGLHIWNPTKPKNSGRVLGWTWKKNRSYLGPLWDFSFGPIFVLVYFFIQLGFIP